MEQRVNIKFRFKLGKTAMEIHEMVLNVYDGESVSKKSVFEWIKCFRDWKEDVEDEPRLGWLSTSLSLDNIQQVWRMLADDRPKHGSSSTSSFPSLKHLNHAKTYFFFTASSLYTFSSISCVSIVVLPNLKQNLMFMRCSISQWHDFSHWLHKTGCIMHFHLVMIWILGGTSWHASHYTYVITTF